jgi:hypothetical protein
MHLLVPSPTDIQVISPNYWQAQQQRSLCAFATLREIKSQFIMMHLLGVLANRYKNEFTKLLASPTTAFTLRIRAFA